MKFPFFSFDDLPEQVKNEYKEKFASAITSGQFIGGPLVTSFESEFSSYLGAAHCVGVGNGLDAIECALRALKIGNDDTVAVPAHTFIATWLAVKRIGATPIGVDCDEAGLLDLNKLMSLDPPPKAVIPVHMHGRVVPMKKLMSWALGAGVKVIEDCAQAHGASVEGQKVGTWGHAGAFSFYPTKNLGALGDGGAVVTNDRHLAEQVRILGNYGSSSSSKYVHLEIGFNSRLDSIQAAFLATNLKFLDEWNDRRRDLAKIYLDSFPLLPIHNKFNTRESVYHHFPVLVHDRNEVIKKLSELEIGFEIHYPQTAGSIYQKLLGLDPIMFPNADFISKHIISLPLSPWMPRERLEKMCKILIANDFHKSLILE
jgi:dTDP-4-amino-4,6-dideoxygalactose transaminase